MPVNVSALTAAEAAMQAATTAVEIATAAAQYYDVLIAGGVGYGTLAKQVVLDNELAGIVANRYARNKLENDKGHTFTAAERAAVQKELVLRDFVAREAASFADISGSAISDYHDETFQNVISPTIAPQEAWTAYHVVRAMNNTEF